MKASTGNEILHINLPDELMDEFDIMCLKHNAARSDLLRSLLLRHEEVALSPTSTGKFQLTVNINRALLGSLRRRAKENGLSLSETVRQIIRHHTK